MSNVVVKMLDPEQYYLLEEFCEAQGIPMLNPEWSKVVAAIDLDTEKVVGIVATQMQAHTEPIWIQKEYQDGKLWEEMVDIMEGYLDSVAMIGGSPIVAWNNPTNPAAERICRLRGYHKTDNPVYVKIYTGAKLVGMLTKEG